MKMKRDCPDFLFKKLSGSNSVNAVDLINKIIMHGDESLQMKLIDDYKEKLDILSGMGWRELAANGTNGVKIRLIRDYQEKLDNNSGAGWYNIIKNGSEAIHMLLISECQDKLNSGGTRRGWQLLYEYGNDAVKDEIEVLIWVNRK
jgi:hypothetical protein